MEEIESKISDAYKIIESNVLALNIKPTTIVAVSKKQSVEKIISAYNCGIRHFGENYIDELFQKSRDVGIEKYCPDICWHFIGTLQSNKINKLLNVRNLYMIQSLNGNLKNISSLNKKISSVINNLDDSFRYINANGGLRVMIQVNTSQEDSKGGCEMSQVDELYRNISDCEFLIFHGFMTIGMKNCSDSQDFKKLKNLRINLYNKYRDCESIFLSMGMSQDYESAIKHGSDIVRIGSLIFGKREL